jgi:signal peptidase II
MLYLFCGLLAAALVALDQWVKGWIVGHFAVGETAPLIPRVLGLTHVHNTGGAWSLLNQHTWLLSVVSAVVILLLLFVLVSRKVRQPFGVLTLTLVLAGAVGNLIDRVRLGYVVDMFQTLFMNFPIFNVADICVVCGGLAFCLWFVLRGEK